MNTELATRQNGADYGMDLTRLGDVLVRSKFFRDTTDAAQAIVKVLAGAEMGFGPIASMTGVYIIEGKPSVSAGLMASAVKRSGRYSYRLEKGHPTATECTIHFYEGKELIGSSSFTWAEAQAAGLVGKPTWKQYPKNMLFARALSNGVKWHCPDVFQGTVYLPEELGAEVNEDGEAVSLPTVITVAALDAEEARRETDPHWQELGSTEEQRATLEAGQTRDPRTLVDWVEHGKGLVERAALLGFGRDKLPALTKGMKLDDMRRWCQSVERTLDEIAAEKAAERDAVAV